jgi:hydrogenase-4 component B
MQYSSGSFASLATRWFSTLFRVERTVRRPRGPFPAQAMHLERVPETVLERVIEPMGRAILQVSTLVRRLQHGRLQFYIVYVVVGLAALGTLVALEGKP